ncbi:hypothetical protein IIU_06075 [Bacillus cereus VD133]|uniref:Uncharacterized protein n=1 Tax=Bacillus cereus VD133 TaxID=1053233 RepID=A0A9W5UZM9_BACCE|nr:hypothetical protein IIU_06075 [Bacillus cereus VD133]
MFTKVEIFIFVLHLERFYETRRQTNKKYNIGVDIMELEHKLVNQKFIPVILESV